MTAGLPPAMAEPSMIIGASLSGSICSRVPGRFDELSLDLVGPIDRLYRARPATGG